MKRIAVVIWLALGLGSAGNAQGQREVTLVAPGGIRAAIEQLTPGFERKTGSQGAPGVSLLERRSRSL
jgi:ABC-type molybdate transport system substrate-binding protein